MPRKQREKSGTGIYHVMMRGINHQDIFEDRADYWKFLKLLRMQTHPEDKQGHALPAHMTIYAYCLMSNHVHLLVRELAEGLVHNRFRCVIRSPSRRLRIHGRGRRRYRQRRLC